MDSMNWSTAGTRTTSIVTSPAVACFLLLAFRAYNLFHAFLALNLKPELRRGRTMTFWVHLIAAEIYAVPRLSLTAAPP
jgi:hypothetical protein